MDMTIDNSYNYVTIMAFEQLYKYENKKSISIQKLKNFRDALYEEVLDIYKNGRGHNYLQKEDQWHGEVSFKQIDENEALNHFLQEYADYFSSDGRMVYLKENVKYKDISELLMQIKVYENVSNRFNIVEDSQKLMDILGFKSLKKIVEEYSKIEDNLENLYYKLYTNEDSKELRKKIKLLLLIRFSFFARISSMPEYRVDAFRLVAGEYGSEKFTEYDEYPINQELWEEEYADPDDFMEDMDDRVYDITQYAIFGKKNNSLYLEKIREDLTSYYMSQYHFGVGTNEQEFDPTKDYTEIIESNMITIEQFEDDLKNHPERFAQLHDPTDEFWVLYMNYLNNLNNFMAIYGQNEVLLFAKKRLLYALDKPELMIFDEKNFSIELEKTKNIELEEDPFGFFEEEIFFIAQEVFMVPCDEYTIRKLLLVATYYDLTKNEDLKETIEEFKDNSNYNFFYDIMINNCKNTNINNLSQDIKRLVLNKF